MEKSICIIGSGNWGTTVARIVGENLERKRSLTTYDREVMMWMFDENLDDGRRLVDVFNLSHENVRYLPGVTVPENVRATCDLAEAVRGRNIFIFVTPHQFIRGTAARISEELTEDQRRNGTFVNFSKGFEFKPIEKKLIRITQILQEELDIDEDQLVNFSGANIAKEVSEELFSLITMASTSDERLRIMQNVVENRYLKVQKTGDIVGSQVAGGIKHIISVLAGFCDGLEMGSNAKADSIAEGFREMKHFASKECLGHLSHPGTFDMACGLADVITSCYGGRNRLMGELFVRTWMDRGAVDLELLETDSFGGQKVQGIHTVREVYDIIESNCLREEFPLFSFVYRVLFEGESPNRLIDVLSL